MKKIILPVLVIFAFSAIQAQNSNVNPEVPAQIKTFINKHFPENTVVKYKKKVESKGTEYKIHLSDFIKLKFNTQFEPVEIESETRLPESVIPSKIATYVKSNYPDLYIVEWEKKNNKQEIELNNDLELEFDLDGNFLRIDD